MQANATEYKYIDSPRDLEAYYSNDEIVTHNIRFISVLTSLEFIPNKKCLLIFQNFEHGRPDECPYTAKIRCDTAETSTLTRMMLSLIAQQFDLDLPDLDDPSGFHLQGIYFERLCFVKCQGRFVSTKNKGSIFLQDIRCIDLNGTLYTARTFKESNEITTLNKIFDNLIRLNNDPKNDFKFVKLLNYDHDMKKFIQNRQENLALTNFRKNPIFGVNRYLPAQESQDDFDSQRMETQSTLFGFTAPEHDNPTDLQQTHSKHSPPGLSGSLHDTSTEDLIEESDSSTSEFMATPVNFRSCRNNTKDTANPPKVVRPDLTTSNSRRLQSSEESGLPLNPGESNLSFQRNVYTRITAMIAEHSTERESAIARRASNVVVSQSIPDTTSKNGINQTDDTALHRSNFQPELSTVTSTDTNEQLKKRQKLDIPTLHIAVSPEILSLVHASPNRTFRLQGKFVGMLPNELQKKVPQKISTLKLYFQPASWDEKVLSSKYLNASKNCLEVVACNIDQLLDIFSLSKQPDNRSLLGDISTVLLYRTFEVKIQKRRVSMAGTFYSFCWSLTDISTDSPKKIEEKRSQSSFPVAQGITPLQHRTYRVDPVKTVGELSVEKEGDVEFVTIFALMVAAKINDPYKKRFIFTDFTANPLTGSYTFDPFICSYNNRISSTETLHSVMYDDEYGKFLNRITQCMRCKFEDLFNVKDSNLTHRGIVCKLGLRVKIYKGKLDGVIRSCIPMMNDSKLTYMERTKLHDFYTRTIRRIPKVHLNTFYSNFQKFFPLIISQDGQVELKKSEHDRLLDELYDSDDAEYASKNVGPEDTSNVGPVEQIVPQLGSYLGDFEVVKNLDIPALNTIEKLTPKKVYHVQGKVVDITQDDDCLSFLITNDLISEGVLDPTRILKVDIIGQDNLDYFYNQRDYKAFQNDLTLLVGKILAFRLSRALIAVSSKKRLFTWYPVECTMEEMKSQLQKQQLTVSVKQEQIDLTDM